MNEPTKTEVMCIMQDQQSKPHVSVVTAGLLVGATGRRSYPPCPHCPRGGGGWHRRRRRPKVDLASRRNFRC